MTTYVENPQDYRGRHRIFIAVPVTFEVCARDGCAALVGSDETHRGDVHGDEYAGRHQWNVRRHRQAPWAGAR